MIWTLTLNPSIDHFTELEDLQPGTTNRAQRQRYLPGGKGINVSTVLKNAGIPVRTIVCLGGFTGDYIQSYLENEGYQPVVIPLDDTTRINMKIHAAEETEVNGAAPAFTEADAAAVLNTVEQIPAGDVLVLSGSLPDTLSTDFYAGIIARARNKGIQTVLDTSGEALRKGMEAGPYLIKPNEEELAAIYGESIDGMTEAVRLAQRAAADGASHVLLSRGGDPSVFTDGSSTWTAVPPEGTVVNTVGAGDSTAAGFLAASAAGLPPEEAFLSGIAYGSATAFTEGFGSPEAAAAIQKNLIMTKLEEEIG
ncbi:1-phosphofructokinase [Alkalicoccus chagannorensis]|uniref:1-phosphofructokinase n=1 Tax=Alkalicoccus chagannorensis TaxID=427072 RepID=UPI00041E646D|nr:1-phosphofructokinase [Alkalicoccus chagannorensis]